MALKADVELGGTDQTFNLLMGRFVQEHYDQKAQVILTMPILEGLDGVAKMSKSLNNYIGLFEPAEQAYGKLMSISDVMMWRYMQLLLRASSQEISSLQESVAAGNLHPMALKKKIAHDIIAKFWSAQEADAAQAQFEAMFQRKDYSQADTISFAPNTANPTGIIELLNLLKVIKSNSEGKRLVEEGAVRVDDAKISDVHAKVSWKSGTTIRVGKHRIFKIN